MLRCGLGALVVGMASFGLACGSDDKTPSNEGTAGTSTSGTSGGGGGSGGIAATGSGGVTSTGAAGSNPGTGGSQPGTGGAGSGTGGAGGSMASGNGIAAKHPGDVGIAMDPAVIFADDFESYAKPADLNKRWDAVYQNQYVTLSTDPKNIYAGKQALEFTLPQQDAELSDATDKLVSPELDVLYLRYYSKFQPPYDVIGSSHNGSSISAHYFINGMATPGVPADGKNKFLANLEDWRGDAATPSPGPLNIYVYQPEQRSQYGDHLFPTGVVTPYSPTPFDFGPEFVKRPDVTPELDRWYCYEYMVKANTPGQRDGRITFWLDGKLVGDFPNLRLRDVATLKIDRFGLSFHIHNNPNGVSKKWYDNVVAATAYIGPIAPP
jgi:hypothetical protein